MKTSMPKKNKTPQNPIVAVLGVKFPSSETDSSIEFDTIKLECQDLFPSFSTKRQEVRLFFLAHTREFRWELALVMEAYLNCGPGKRFNDHAEDLMALFQNNWQVRLSFWPPDFGREFHLGDFYKKIWGGKKKRTITNEVRERFYRSMAPFIEDMKNPSPELIDPANFTNMDISDPEMDEFYKNFFLIQVPYVVNKDELQNLIDRIEVMEQPKDRYITTDRNVALDIFLTHREQNLTFGQVAKKFHPDLKEDFQRSKKEAYRKLYARIMNAIIDPPAHVKRK